MTIGEQILVWLLVLPLGALLSAIVESVGEKIKRERREQQRAEIERVLRKTAERCRRNWRSHRQSQLCAVTTARKYSGQDALIRIRKLEAAIADNNGERSPIKQSAKAG